MKYDRELVIIRIFQVFALLCIFYAFIYYILKIRGIINTPFWVEISPAISVVAAAATVIFGGVKFYTRLKDLPGSHEKLARRVGRMAIGLTRVEKDVEFLKTDMGCMRTELKDWTCWNTNLTKDWMR
jgi:hypothetical protein